MYSFDFSRSFPVQYSSFLHLTMRRLLPLLFITFLLSACNGESEQARKDYALAQQYSQGAGVEKNPGKAFEFLVKASDEGSAKAALDLGYLYLQGAGVTKDTVKAIQYFQLSAKRGNADASYNLGLAYVHGDGVTKDLKKAATWFTQSALLDDAGAQFNLGLMYLNGEGVVKNPITAYAWFTLASEKDYQGAKGILSIAEREITPDQALEAQQAIDKLRRTIKAPAQK